MSSAAANNGVKTITSPAEKKQSPSNNTVPPSRSSPIMALNNNNTPTSKRRKQQQQQQQWSQAIQRVIRDERTKHWQEKEERPDLLGERILELLLLSNQEFCCWREQPSSTSTTEEECSCFRWTPLFSRHNWNVLRRRRTLLFVVNTDYSWRSTITRSCWTNQPSVLGRRILRRLLLWFGGSTTTTTTTSSPQEGGHRRRVQVVRPSGKSCLLFFLRLLALGFVLSAVTSTYVLLFTIKTIIMVLGLSIVLLVDLDDYYDFFQTTATTTTTSHQYFYVPVRKIVSILVDGYRYLDDRILQGRRFKGREWNEDDFVFGDWTTDAGSRHATLWELPPPPSSHQLWWGSNSTATLDHVAAIEYCYTMMNKEHLRKQNKRRQQRRKVAMEKRSVSMPDRVDGTTGGNDNNSMTPVRGGTMLSSSSQLFSQLDNATQEVTVISESPENVAAMDKLAADSIEGAIELKVKSGLETTSLSNVFSSEEEEYSTVLLLNAASDATEREAEDLPWLDVGARIGMKVLNSEHVQRAMASQETKDRIMETMDSNHPRRSAAAAAVPKTPVSEPRRYISKPMHSMWTSPAAAAAAMNATLSLSNLSRQEDEMDDLQLIKFSQTFPTSPASDRPPLSPPLSPLKRSSSPSKSPQRKQSVMQSGRAFSCGGVAEAALSSPTTSLTVAQQAISPPGIQRMPLPDTLARTPDPPMKLEQKGRSCYTVSPLEVSAGYQSPKPSTSEARKKPSRRRGTTTYHRRSPLLPGVKVAVPIFPVQPNKRTPSVQMAYQMTTVVASSRIYVGNHEDCHRQNIKDTNCLSVTVKLDKFFLRNGEFADLTFRIMDEWSPRFMPRHSKVPIGSCVATSFGIGVLVGWRVEDDCHVVRSLWHCRGAGSAHAYLNRNAIKGTIEAAVGFRVQTLFGWGVVVGTLDCGDNFELCRFLVEIKEEGRHQGHVLELGRKEILSCHGAQFLPVIEHVREAALYQIQLDNYNAALREQRLNDGVPTVEQEFLWNWTACADILWHSFLKAVDEDNDFDDGVNDFMQRIINFLERLDEKDDECTQAVVSPNNSDHSRDSPTSGFQSFPDEIEVQLAPRQEGSGDQEPGFWIMNDLFGGVFNPNDKTGEESLHSESSSYGLSLKGKKPSSFDRALAFLRTVMKTVSIARAASVDHPHFRLALAISYDFLLFIRTIIKVQQRNTSAASLSIWKRAWEEIVSTFGPIKQRLESIAQGIARRMEDQGRKAKIRVLKFVDKLLSDERLLFALEQGEWDRCLARLEIALIEAQVIEEENLLYYRKAAKFVYDHVHSMLDGDGKAATRNTEKLAFLAKAVQLMAAPRRSFLKLFCRDDALELFERILVRAYYKEDVATRMLTIHAANFHSLRHLRMLKDFSVAGRIWIPLLDAADEEFSWLVSKLPENSKEFMCPLSSLFSLCVAQFHKIAAGDLSRDWLAFLLEEESVRIIHDIDMVLILAFESFSRDIREMITVLPYYPSIDNDILNLMDEVNLDEFLKETSDAIDDPDKFSYYVREKATIGVERFLNYLPKMSIPVEKRDLGDGWVMTCHGEDGGGLTLSDVSIKRENLVCQVMGGDTLFFPTFCDEGPDKAVKQNGFFMEEPIKSTREHEEESILDHIRELIINAQMHGCWESGRGGIGKPPTDRYAASVLNGLPVSRILNTAIELWRNLEIDDDELLEIAIRDISYHIQLKKEDEEKMDGFHAASPDSRSSTTDELTASPSFASHLRSSISSESDRHRFNPRVDPTVLFLEIKRLTLNLENFSFRIEKAERTIFDPVFEGRGMLSLQNISIRLRVECAKESVKKPGLDTSSPVLQLRDLEVKLEKLEMAVRDTGFGSDWILNKAVEVFEDKLTEVVEENLKEQIMEQIQNALNTLNSYFLMNPGLLLTVLGVSMEDLPERNVVWV